MSDYKNLIQKFFAKNLNDNEQALFDSLKNSNEEFIALFNEHKNMHAAFQIIEDKEVSDLINSIEKEKGSRNIIFKIAAVLTVFITGYYFLFYSGNNFDSYLEEYPNVHFPITRSETENDMYKAFSAYEKKDYELAIEKFDNLLLKETTPEIKFYKAMALLNIDKKEQALSILKELQNIDFDYSQETLWYLSITHLLLNEKDSAKFTLELMDKQQMKFKKSQRLELLNKLN
jgi:tetratricopeptide (TPR) repeat protein